jgi:glycosyltransferase involved in cell wall biosynthesis
MNCYNGAEYLREAIDSVYAQTWGDWEIIFWDNASTDASAEIAKSYDNRLIYYRSAETVPLGKARGWALGKAQGKYVAFLDCDDSWHPSKLEKQVRVFEADPRVDFIYTNYIRHDELARQKKIALKGAQPEGDVFGRFLRRCPVGVLTVMLRKSALDACVDCHDDRFNLCSEYYTFMRLLFRSRAAYIDEPLAVYRIHRNMQSIRRQLAYSDEIRSVLDRFRETIPAVADSYGSEMNSLLMDFDCTVAYGRLLSDERSQARRMLSGYVKVSKRALVFYLLSLCPMCGVRAVDGLRRRFIGA